MQRTKEGGCDSGLTGNTSNGAGTAANQSNTGSHYKYDITPGYKVAEMDTREASPSVNSAINRNKTVNCLRDICGAKLKDDDILVSLTDSEWKVDQTAEKLLKLNLSTHTEPQISTVSTANSDGQQKSLKLNLANAKLPPQSRDPVVLPLLSPKTPHVVSSFLNYGESATPETVQPAMDALGRFGETTSSMVYLDPCGEPFPHSPGTVMEPNSAHGVGLTSVAGGPIAGSVFVSTQQSSDGPGLSTIIEHQRTESLSPSSQGEVSSLQYNSGPSLIQEQAVSPSAMSAAFPQRVMSLTVTPAENNNSSQNKSQVHVPQKPRGSRKKTLSLNPEEREALENLIEDVIMGGVASDESSNSSDSDDDGQLQDGSAAGIGNKDGVLNKEGLPKIYPAQLKVAVKHMRNLPPRFMRRLENAQKKIDAAERIEAERAREEQARLELEAREKEQEKLKSREDQKREKKKKIRNLLDDLDQYTDEQSVSQNKDTEHCISEGNENMEAQNKALTEHTKEVECFMESSQPVHVGLSKVQISQAVLSHQELAQKQLPSQNSSLSGTLPTGKVMNCEDLERELLNRVDYGVPTSMAMFCNNQHTDLGAAGSAISMNIHAYNIPGNQNAGDMVDRRTFLSADAPEFVPLNFLTYGPQPSGQNFKSAAMHVQPTNMQMQSTGSTVQCQNPHVLLSNSNLHETKFRPLPKESSPICIEMLQNNSSSQYSQSPMGRMSPQVVNAHTSRSSPQPVSASAADGPVPPPPTSQSVGKLPTFLVPKVPTTIPMHQPSAPPAAVPHHQGIAGVIPLNPYQIPYNYATAAFPPQQGFTYQPFFPPTSYMPWNENSSEKLGPRGLIGHHPLIGVPLKASPQMTRKRGTPHPGLRPGATPVRHSMLQTNKPPANDVKVLNAESAKKLLMQLFEEGKKVLVLLRGCPGSGKSSLAKEIVFDGAIISTDDYFINSRGAYEYDKAALGEAHLWNQNRAKQALEAGTNPIIIDNTNSQSWEMKSYVSMAQKQGYHIEIVEPNTPWRQNAKELAKRNIHGVSLSSIRKMLDLYEHNVTLQNIMGVQTPTEKQTPVEMQQLNQSEGEQQEQKTPHRRRRKKRKRKRHRSKKDKGGSLEESQKHFSGESTDEDDSVEKGTAQVFRLLEKRSSLTSNDTTTSPRETTPELMERSDQWENAFSDIKEDSQQEQDRAKDIEYLEQPKIEDNKRKYCLLEGVDVFEEATSHIDVNEFQEEDYNNGIYKVLDAGIITGEYGYGMSSLASNSHTAALGMDSSVVSNTEDGAANAVCDKNGHILADVFNKQDNCPDSSGDLSDIRSCHSGNDSNEVENIVVAVINELLSLVETRISDALQSQHCAQTDPGTNCMNEDTSDRPCKNHVNNTTLVSDETCISTNSCDQHFSNNVMTTHSNSAVMLVNTASESVATLDAVSAKEDEKLVLKQKITDCLQERVLQALLEQELMIVLDDTGEYLENCSHGNKTSSSLPDVTSELDNSEEIHLTSLDDLKKALEDIGYDNPTLENDSDIELDYEYGLEAIGTSMKIQGNNIDNKTNISCQVYVPIVLLDEKEKCNASSNEVAEEKYGSLQMSKELDFISDNENSPLTTSDDPAKIASSYQETEKCKHEVHSSAVNERFSEKQKSVEEQYWMTTNTDAYCIPVTNNVNVYPVINSASGDFIKDSHVDSMVDGNLLPTDVTLVKPKPKRERTVKKRALRKSRTVDTDNSGKQTYDEWIASDKLDGVFHIRKECESVDKDQVQSHHDSIDDTCNDSLTSTSEICYQSQQSLEQLDCCDAGKNSTNCDKTSQTEPRDLVFVHKLRQCDLEAVLVMDEFSIQGILETTPRDISWSNNANISLESVSGHSWICKVHTSSQTKEVPELTEDQQLQDKIVTLRMCFPRLSKEDAEHILEQCQGDMEWASNILLDCSTEPCLTEKEDKSEPSNHNVVCDIVERYSPTQEDQLTEKENITDLKKKIQDPESLVDICCKKLVSLDLFIASDTVLHELETVKLDHLKDNSHLLHKTLDEYSKHTETYEEPCAPTIPCSAATTSGITDSAYHQESSITESDDCNRIVLKMPKEFAEQILQLFGPLQNMPVTLADESMDVHLDRKTAKEVYDCWEKTLTEKLLIASSGPVNSSDTVSEDEALARCLQEEEYRVAGCSDRQVNSLHFRDGLHQTGKQKNNKKSSSPYSSPSNYSTGTASPAKTISRTSSPNKVGLSPLHNGDIITLSRPDRSQSPVKTSVLTSPSHKGAVPNLREIMDEELALEASIAEYLNSQNDVQTNKDTLSTRMNWQKLVEKFPKVDEVMLYDVFQSTGYHMESTVSTIERSLSLQGPPKTVLTQEVAEQMEHQMFKQAIEESLKMWPDTEETPTREDLYHTLEDPLYSDFRAEAYEHYKQRQDCLQKAAEAYRKGMLQVASYYSQQSQLHYEKLKEANHRTAEMIVNYKAEQIGKTNSLDLHGLHVDEALKTLEAVLAKREIEQREKPDKRKSHLMVVTGRGIHSRGGVARIRPAVVDFLRKHHYSFTEPSPSIIKVHLKYRDANRL